MATPAQHNFTVVEGDTFVKTFTVTSDGSTPIDLSAATVTMEIRTSYTASAASVSIAVGSGLTMTDAPNGVFDISKNISLAEGEYVYDVQYVISGVTSTILRGKFIVLPGVTA